MAIDKKTHNIYLIDIEKINKLSSSDNVSIQKITEFIMSTDNQYHIQELKKDLNTNGFNISLFFRNDPPHKSKFSSFCSSFVKEDQDAVNFIPMTASSVMFVWKNEKRLYAITTGQGFRMVENYCIQKFGMIIATLFEQYLKITSLKSNEMSSVIHSAQTIYSKEMDFVSVQTLDTIFKEIGGRINNRELIQNLLNLDNSSKKSMRLKAKDYLHFGCSMDFKGLLHLLQVINEYDISHNSDGFNDITQLTKKKHSDIIDGINDTIIHLIYEAISNNRECPFELFHKDTASYIFADKYQVYSSNFEGTKEDDYDATKLLKNSFSMIMNGAEWTENEFKRFINLARIRTMNDDRLLTDGTILSHISGEIEFGGKNYMVIDGEYYCQSISYIKRLNDLLRKKLRKEYFTNEIKTKWEETKNEDWFNDTVAKDEGYVELHRQLVDNIEFADLLYYANGILTVIHVKDGFDGEMRVLDRQVEMSLSMLMDVKNNNSNSYIKNLYRKAVNNDKKTRICIQFKSENEFIDIIRNSKVRYIIVIRPSNKDLLKCPSNVAKHCLNSLIDRCNRRGIEFNIQIK